LVGVEVEAGEQVVPPGRVEAPAQPGEQVDDFAAGEVGPEGDIARDVGNPSVQLRHIGPRVAAQQSGLATVGAQQPEQDPDRRRLARAVGSEETVNLALLDGEVQAVEGDGGAEGFTQPADLDRSTHSSMVTPLPPACPDCPLGCSPRPSAHGIRE
jgi:hypothetical protein